MAADRTTTCQGGHKEIAETVLRLEFTAENMPFVREGLELSTPIHRCTATMSQSDALLSHEGRTEPRPIGQEPPISLPAWALCATRQSGTRPHDSGSS